VESVPTTPTAAPVTSAASTPTASTRPPESKAAFVRAYPSLSAKEVVEKAKAKASYSAGDTSTMFADRTRRAEQEEGRREDDDLSGHGR
jgi:hypothetical protein